MTDRPYAHHLDSFLCLALMAGFSCEATHDYYPPLDLELRESRRAAVTARRDEQMREPDRTTDYPRDYVAMYTETIRRIDGEIALRKQENSVDTFNTRRRYL